MRGHIICQNRKISPIVTHAQKILGIYGKPLGYYYIETNPTNMLGLGATRSGKGGGFITETKGNVFSSMMAGITLFLQDNVAKLTSKNAIGLTSVGFPRRLAIRFRSTNSSQLKNTFLHQAAKVTITIYKQWGKSPKEVVHVKEATDLVDEAGYLIFAIAPKLPDIFQIKIDFNHEANSKEIYFCDSVYHRIT